MFSLWYISRRFLARARHIDIMSDERSRYAASAGLAPLSFAPLAPTTQRTGAERRRILVGSASTCLTGLSKIRIARAKEQVGRSVWLRRSRTPVRLIARRLSET